MGRACYPEWCVCSNVYVMCQIFQLQFLLESTEIDCCVSKICQPAEMGNFKFLHIHFMGLLALLHIHTPLLVSPF